MEELDLRVPDGVFDLCQTLDCGQAFRWRALPEGGYEGAVGRFYCRVTLRGDTLRLQKTGGDAAFWERYFDLKRDYSAIQRTLGANETLRRAVAFAPGLRVLRQPEWETLCSFIISQNNNVPRIKGIIERLCQAFGEEIAPGWHSFPAPEKLAGLEPQDLAVLRCGFRARYLLDAAAKAADGRLDLPALGRLPEDQARAALTGVTGVGPKVADCVLLFSYGRLEAFPADVWIKRAMQHLFPEGLPEFALPWAGIVQQYLFHYARCCPQALEGTPGDSSQIP